ncbi:MAG: sodium ion-translocating decarboxylase subunit beta [Lentisphaeria bacterium]|jgi:oxaloacetate decarboxylase beta subunit|nr:sodium ion-translocating decarboxylase subunit beta [Lentisphaeria bacterium]
MHSSFAMRLLGGFFAVLLASACLVRADGRISVTDDQPPAAGDMQRRVFDLTQGADDVVVLSYVWPTPAIVYQVSVEPGQIVRPGRSLFILSIKSDHSGSETPFPSRSKADYRAGMTYKVEEVLISRGDKLAGHATGPEATAPAVLLKLRPMPNYHDSTTPSESGSLQLGPLVRNLWHSTGLYALVKDSQNDWTLGFGQLIMMGVGLVLIYLAIVRGFEPLLLLPIGFGAVMSNIPVAMLAGPDGILGMIYAVGVETGVFPLFIFMGVGAMTDFGPLIANPWTALLGGAAQLGIFFALIGALVLSVYVPGIHFNLKDAASIGIIGGADGPTAIFLASRLSPNLLGAIAVAAYSYMALVPIIQPPIMKFLTTKEQRKIRMSQLRPVSKLEKICFPLIITLLCAFLLPDAAPLIGMLMLGNLMRESGVVNRLSDTAQNALINIVTICLGLAVGSKLSADKFLNAQTLGILAMGLVAFCVGTAGGVLLGQVMRILTGNKVNPLIGAAGVSAVPMAARVVNKVGIEDDPHNFLLMHAMGPNVAGVIGSAVAAGVLLNALRMFG